MEVLRPLAREHEDNGRTGLRDDDWFAECGRFGCPGDSEGPPCHRTCTAAGEPCQCSGLCRAACCSQQSVTKSCHGPRRQGGGDEKYWGVCAHRPERGNILRRRRALHDYVPVRSANAGACHCDQRPAVPRPTSQWFWLERHTQAILRPLDSRIRAAEVDVRWDGPGVEDPADLAQRCEERRDFQVTAITSQLGRTSTCGRSSPDIPFDASNDNLVIPLERISDPICFRWVALCGTYAEQRRGRTDTERQPPV